VSSRSVLIVTNEQDLHADLVVEEIGMRRGVAVVRLNTERIADWQVTLEPGRSWRLSSDTLAIDSKDCSGVWWRRPESPARSAATSPAEWEAVLAQWRAVCEGLVSVPGPTWISSPFAIAMAENKALQLSHAASLGFRVPRTLWTNSRANAERLLSELGGEAVCKSLATAYWKVDDTPYFVFALSLTPEDLPAAAGLRLSPLSFQEIITPKRDVRVTVVGRRVLAAVRRSTDAPQPVDWRLGEDADWLEHALPEPTAKACVDLANSMSVRFAGIDLVLDENGDHWFIELNPNGEWRWLQAAGLPVVDALADALTGASAA
jgi:hypothetical protein